MTDPPVPRERTSSQTDTTADIAYSNRIAPVYFERWSWPIQRYTTKVEGRWLREVLGGTERPRVLLAGSGGGREIDALLSLGASIVAVDYSEAMLDVGRVRWGTEVVDWRLADVHDLDGLPSDFDAVVSLAALNYFVDLATALSTMRRHVRPGGTLIVSSINAEHPTERVRPAPGKINRRPYTRGDLTAAVQGAGWDVVDVRGYRILVDRMSAKTRWGRAQLRLALLGEPVLRRLTGPRRSKWIWVIARAR